MNPSSPARLTLVSATVAVAAFASAPSAAGAPGLAPLPAGGDGTVLVEVVFDAGDGDAARREIRAVGGDVGTSITGELTQATIPGDAVAALDRRGSVVQVRAPLEMSAPDGAGADPPPQSLFGDSPEEVGGQEVGKTNASAWHAAGITGGGVKVGIFDAFSGSHYAAAQAAGEVPAPSGTLCINGGVVGCNIWAGGRHGVGVTEVIHDMAPGAEVYLATVATPADYQAAVNWFESQGVDIVNRSLAGQFDNPGNGTGPMATVVDSAVSKGMTWFNSTGNTAGRGAASGSYWRGAWVDSDSDGYLNFSGTDERLGFDCAFMNGFRWSDWGASRTDYDLEIYNAATNALISQSALNQSAGVEPIERAPSCGAGGAGAYAMIKLYAAGGGTAGDVLEFMTNGAAVEYSTDPHSAAGPVVDSVSPGALAVGAIDPPLGTTIASYSSEGPTNGGTLKPDLAAASCVAGLSYADGCFNGTSAASPAAAGAGALVLSSGLATTPAAIKGFLVASTQDRGAAGPDPVYGRGELVLPVPPDRVAPSADAFAAKAKPGKRARLEYTASDDRGGTRETVSVSIKGKVVRTYETGFSQGGPDIGRTVSWKVPRRGSTKRVAFCVSPFDAAGNAGATDCAPIKIKKRKRRR